MPKKQINVLITSAGTASAISFIKALKYQTVFDINITAVDMDVLAPGLHLADQYYIVPPASSPEYVNELIRICKLVNATILIPIYSKEIAKIASIKEELKEKGIQTLLPKSDTIHLANDKYAMSLIAQELGIKTPKTTRLTTDQKGSDYAYPVFVKPNASSSSSGAEKVNDASRLEELIRMDTDLIAQEYITGKEVTVDVFCNQESEPLVIAPRLRLATKSGQSVKGITIDKQRFKEAVVSVCKRLQVVGACNVQFFITPEDELVFIELNPRYAAGGLMLTVKAGANIPLLVIKTILGLPIYPEECETLSGIQMTRYWEEIILNENDTRI